MDSNVTRAVAGALTRIFRPLVRILLRRSVPFHTCAELLRWVYADVAMNEFGIEGRKQTKSRVAVITGLSRKEVDRLLKLPPPADRDQGEQKPWHRATRVLSGWAEDPAYRTASGTPRTIPVEGEAPSFQDLVERYSGGTTVRSVLDEVLAAGAVQQSARGRLKLIRPYYVTEVGDRDLQNLDVLGISAAELLKTVDHNIRPDQDDPHFQRLVFQIDVPESARAETRRHVRERCQALANEIDEYLARQARERPEGPSRSPVSRMGIGIYYFEGETDDE